ncbi:cytochrome c oxidase subunit II [Gilvimarinus sp. DA14]|uniref:cytochrome c oxidase subunit II n=1 Tax=Gilvimarinus sp. DA14 TaxID=2956798 RepID=UPI0020B71472|nr:cytochrome c oxidase subunit II [Gilvimarinus sp. DA14]UTF60210.1 cytochrome c oxidase subunit II [Gilvimarinus sp. DA14]
MAHRGISKIINVIAPAIVLTGCSGPQSALDPAGPGADVIAWLWWGMFAFFSLVLIVVTGLWLHAMARRADTPNDADADAVRLTNRWVIAGGLILPLVSISILLAVGIPAGQYLLTLPDENREPLRVDAHAHRWWWGFYYPDSDIHTGNQLVIPVDTTVEIYGHTDNVIHAFWVPRLGGKIDLVPGRVNTLKLRASETGVMRGQCAEFCGTGHAHMIFTVRVLSQPEFAAWQHRQGQPHEVAENFSQAADDFRNHCGNCHRVRGVSNGAKGPDLSNIGARSLSHLQHRQATELSIAQWLQKPHPRFYPEQAEKVGDIDPETLNGIAQWLETLTP